MTPQPQIEQRDAQPYIGIRTTVTSDGFPEAVDTGFPELFAWLGGHGVALGGAPFIRYLVINGESEFEIEIAAPVESEVQVDGEERIRSGSLPAGRYVTLPHLGPFDGLAARHPALQQWAQAQGVPLDREESDRGTAWGAVVERYLVDPSTEPDPAKWEVELAYLTTGD